MKDVIDINGVKLSPSAMDVLKTWNLDKRESYPSFYIVWIGEVQDFLQEHLSDSDAQVPIITGHLMNLIAIKRDLQRMISDIKEGGNDNEEN